MQRLLALGFVIIFAGFLLLAVDAPMGGSASFGGVVFIGPVPIAFGSGPGGLDLALLSLVIGAVMAVMVFLWWKGPARS